MLLTSKNLKARALDVLLSDLILNIVAVPVTAASSDEAGSTRSSSPAGATCSSSYYPCGSGLYTLIPLALLFPFLDARSPARTWQLQPFLYRRFSIPPNVRA